MEKDKTMNRSQKRDRETTSCTTCRAKKRKCNHSFPCDQCEKRDIGDTCQYDAKSRWRRKLEDSQPQPTLPEGIDLKAIFDRLERLETQLANSNNGTDLNYTPKSNNSNDISYTPKQSVNPPTYQTPIEDLPPFLSPTTSTNETNPYCWYWPPGIDKIPDMKELVSLIENVRGDNNLPPCEWPNLKTKFQIFNTNSDTDVTSFLPPQHISDMLLKRYREVVHPIMPVLDLDEIYTKSEGLWSKDKKAIFNDSHFMAVYFLILAYASRSSGYDVQNHNVTSSLHRLFINAAEHFMSSYVYVGTPSTESFEAILLYSMFMFAGETVQSGRAITSLVYNMAQTLGLYRKVPMAGSQEDIKQNRLFKIFYSFEKSSALDLDQPSYINDRYCYFNDYRHIEFNSCVGFSSIQFQLSRVLSKVVDEVYGRNSCPSSETITGLDNEIRRAIDSIPDELKLIRPSDDKMSISRSDVSPQILMQQYVLNSLAHKILFMLHKTFISRRTGSGQLYPEFEFSRRRGLEASIYLMKNQMEVFANPDLQEFVWCHWHYVYYQAFFAALLVGLDYKQCVELSDQLNAPGEELMSLVMTCREQYYAMRIATMCASARSHLVLSAVLQVKSEFDIPELFGPFVKRENQPDKLEEISAASSEISDLSYIDAVLDDTFFQADGFNSYFTNASAIYNTAIV